MILRGDIFVEDLDILMYKGVYDIASGIITKIEEELIPSFIVEESLLFFEEKEEYEKCLEIKEFFDDNKEFLLDITREKWFGLEEKDKNKDSDNIEFYNNF